MTFTLYKASDYKFMENITINSLEELKAIDFRTVVDFEEMSITIYDDYLE